VQIASLMVLLDDHHQESPDLPQFLWEPLEKVIRNIATLSPLFVFACTPPEAWKMGWTPSKDVQFPALPVDYLLEPEVLEQFIFRLYYIKKINISALIIFLCFRLNMIGWSNRLHFEESWMAYLGVLNASLEHDVQPEEAAAITQAQCLAVKGITSLILQSLVLPEPGRLASGAFIHVPRGSFDMYLITF
jgi:hypothetical protein